MVKAVALFPTTNSSTYLYVTNTTISFRGVTSGCKGGAISQAPKSLWGRRITPNDSAEWGAENFQQSHKYFLQYSKFASIRPQIQIWGHQIWFLRRAPRTYSPGRNKFGGAKGPSFESKSRSFESKCTVLKKVFVTLLGFYGAPSCHPMSPAAIWLPHKDSAAWELCARCPPALCQ